jgi:hypothetical protein
VISIDSKTEGINMKKLIAAVLFMFSSLVFAGSLPLVPGKLNPDVTQDNIKTTICVSGWTKTVRPTVGYTNKLKLQQMKQFGLTGKPQDYEEDHKVNLGLGGHPSSPDNLWPQPWTGPDNAHKKDAIEVHLQRMVCAGKIPLKEAQAAMMDNWETAYAKYIGPLPK